MSPHVDLSVPGPKTDFPMRKAIGQLAWLAHSTRPDIATAVSKLAQWQEEATQTHVDCVFQILSYLKLTIETGLTYYKDNQEPYFAVCDASLGKEKANRSRTGYAIFRGGAAVLYATRVQRNVSTSIAGAEFMSASECTKRLMWLHETFSVMGWDIPTPIKLQCDNVAAIYLSKGQGDLKLTGHIALHDSFVRQQAELGFVKMEHVPTNDNPSDHLTKVLDGHKFYSHAETLMGKPENPQFSLSRLL